MARAAWRQKSESSLQIHRDVLTAILRARGSSQSVSAEVARKKGGFTKLQNWGRFVGVALPLRGLLPVISVNLGTENRSLRVNSSPHPIDVVPYQL
eukprot:2667480-Rhodomonas_salina.1